MKTKDPLNQSEQRPRNGEKALTTVEYSVVLVLVAVVVAATMPDLTEVVAGAVAKMSVFLRPTP
jgi:Flp pilus assembly pilin Flp